MTITSSSLAQIAFPIVRRVFPSLIANELVSVQPMGSPNFDSYYADYNPFRDRFSMKNYLYKTDVDDNDAIKGIEHMLSNPKQ